MKKRKARKRKQRVPFITLLLILSLVGSGCGDNRQTKDSAQTSQTERADTASKEGIMSHGYFFEEDGIVVSSRERFLYSDWEPVEFDYICMDPTCTHLTESCSARTIQDENGMLKDFSLVYQDRLNFRRRFRNGTKYIKRMFMRRIRMGVTGGRWLPFRVRSDRLLCHMRQF